MFYVTVFFIVVKRIETVLFCSFFLLINEIVIIIILCSFCGVYKADTVY